MKICVYTLGCKVNTYESEAIIQKLIEKGYEVTTSLESSDIFVLNTCAVTNEAEKKSRQIASKMRKLNDKAKFIICGCSTQNNSSKYSEDNTLIFGTGSKIDVVNKIEELGNFVEEPPLEYQEIGIAKTDRARTYIKIQDGCNHFCSYCIVPIVRGRSRSRDIENIVEEISLNTNKTKEFVLTGISISDFGAGKDYGLVDLLKRLENINARIRLGSLEISAVSEELLLQAKRMDNFCDHFHLSMQSGSDEVLKKMNRHYTTNEYLDTVNRVRKHFPNAGITTDIIAGFPSETEENHKETLAFAREVGFSDIHAFPYSKREGTKARSYKQVDSAIIKRRASELLELKKELKNKYLNDNLNKELEILVEEKIKNYYVGYTKNYIRAYIKSEVEVQDRTVVILKGKSLLDDGILFS